MRDTRESNDFEKYNQKFLKMFDYDITDLEQQKIDILN